MYNNVNVICAISFIVNRCYKRNLEHKERTFHFIRWKSNAKTCNSLIMNMLSWSSYCPCSLNCVNHHHDHYSCLKVGCSKFSGGLMVHEVAVPTKTIRTLKSETVYEMVCVTKVVLSHYFDFYIWWVISFLLVKLFYIKTLD